MTKFAPTIMVDGRSVAPEGWMWVLCFALAGCEWAVVEADKPEFREFVAAWIQRHKRDEALQEIAALEDRIDNIKASLNLK
jgi:hypothetical protein